MPSTPTPTIPWVRSLLVLLLAATLLVPAARPARAATDVQRLAGTGRVETSVAVALSGWDSAPRVLLATSSDYPDAVAAASLAAQQDAPVLLNPPAALAASVREALAHLGTAEVTVLGGERAISPAVVEELGDLGLEVRRVAGASRFETATLIAESVTAAVQPSVVAVALGARSDDRDAWPDALSAASLAGLDVPVPTLLSAPTELPDATLESLRSIAPDQVVVLGGPAAVSDPVLEQIRALGIPTGRLEGATRYATSVTAADAAIHGLNEHTGTLDATQAVFVSGNDFPDALAGGALAARRSAPLLLVPERLLDDHVDGFLREAENPVSDGVVIGGDAAVSDHVHAEIVAAIDGAPRPAPPPPPEPECPANSSPDCAYTYRHPIATWERLARCESGGNWSINTGNGYYGGLQFSLSSWRAVGGPGYPHQNSKWEQIHRGERLQAAQGWGAWPSCSRKLGLR